MPLTFAFDFCALPFDLLLILPRKEQNMVSVNTNGNSSALIQVRGLNKTYRRGGEQIQVLQGLNLDVDKGDFVAFMGPSGSGKTTLLNLLGGLDVPTSGTVSVAGDEITHMSSGKLTEWRARHVGFVFQMYNLVPVLTAYQNVELPLLLTRLSRSARRQHVEAALAIVGLARPRAPFSPPALRRAGAACRHRPRHRFRSHLSPLRRAHRRPRPQERR